MIFGFAACFDRSNKTEDDRWQAAGIRNNNVPRKCQQAPCQLPGVVEESGTAILDSNISNIYRQIKTGAEGSRRNAGDIEKGMYRMARNKNDAAA
jgi:hypothetical protein